MGKQSFAMGFYIRKNLMSGPLRLNLSKGGVGFSFGVKGARIGVNRKGTYVHGGRYGAYYRKYMTEDGEEEWKGNKRRTVEFFTDTGLTYPRPDLPQKPKLPKVKPPPVLRVNPFIKAGLILGPLILLAIFSGFYFLSGIGAVLTAIAYPLYFNQKGQINKAKVSLNNLKHHLDQKQPVPTLIKSIKTRKLKPKYRQWRDYHFLKALNQQFYEDPDYITPDEFREVEKLLHIPKKQKRLVKRHIFSRFLHAVLEDHFISRQEEDKLMEVVDNLNLSLGDIPEEKALIDVMHKLRETISAPLEAVGTSLNLKQGEVCYYITEGRFLKEKYVDRFKKNGVFYKAKGYELDMEGELYLTDRRLLMVSEGSREYRLNKILDVTLSLEDNSLKLTVDDRKNPVVVTAPAIEVLAGKLERLILDEESAVA